jgi:hypothetical protein
MANAAARAAPSVPDVDRRDIAPRNARKSIGVECTSSCAGLHEDNWKIWVDFDGAALAGFCPQFISVYLEASNSFNSFRRSLDYF